MAQTELRGIICLENRNSKSWENLPIDHLSEIYTRIHAVDQSTFRLVCKSWNKVQSLKARPLKLESHHPCLLFKKTTLYHPIYDTHHNIDLWPDEPDAIVNVAKDDWFLMTRNKEEVFFYNTITKATVKLPNLIHHYGLRSMCFSAPPTSKGWEVIAAIMHPVETATGSGRYDDHVLVDSIKDGEENWSSCRFHPKRGTWGNCFEFTYCNAVLHNGLYYFLGQDAMVLIHDSNKRKFYYHVASYNLPQSLKVCGGNRNQYMFESDGKLMAVFVNIDGSVIRACQWDASEKEWKIVESLGNKMWFVSDISCMSEKAVVQGTGNKIYFPSFVDDHGLYYSLSTKKYHTFEGGSYRDFNFRRLKRFFDSAWIKLAKSV